MLRIRWSQVRNYLLVLKAAIIALASIRLQSDLRAATRYKIVSFQLPLDSGHQHFVSRAGIVSLVTYLYFPFSP